MCRVASASGSAVVPGAFPLATRTRSARAGIEIATDQRFFDERRRHEDRPRARRDPARAEGGGGGHGDDRVALLARSEPGNGTRVVDGEPLTSSCVKRGEARVFAEHGCDGRRVHRRARPQAAVGHDMGAGPIAAASRSSVDLLPRDSGVPCFADMTRTFVVGQADAELASSTELTREALELCRRRWSAPASTGPRSTAPSAPLLRQPAIRPAARRPTGRCSRTASSTGSATASASSVHEAPSLGRYGRARRRRRRHARARPLPEGLRRRAARGSHPRHRGRLREADRLPVRARSARPW